MRGHINCLHRNGPPHSCCPDMLEVIERKLEVPVMQMQHGILTAMADAVVADWGEERRLRIDKESPFAKTLDSIRLPDRGEWFKGYFCGRLGVLLASIVDSAYRLDLVLGAPSPAGVSVVEYHILRPMLEYAYKLLNLVQVEIGVQDRERRAIEDWYSDYRQFRRISPTHQHVEHERYFTRWEPVLTQWYTELTACSKIREVTSLEIFNQVGMPDSGWPLDLPGKRENPVYRSGYSVYSAVEHGNLWAVRRYGMNLPSDIPLERNGLDDMALLHIQDVAGSLLQSSYASFKQFAQLGAGGAVMNKLGQHLAVIWEMMAELEAKEPRTTGYQST